MVQYSAGRPGRSFALKEGARSVIYDSDLDVEAYQFDGIMQKFPNHFHEYYVIGFIENGLRRLSCRNQEYIIAPGDLLLFNPHDNHTCEQIGVCTLEYRCLNIRKDSMEKNNLRNHRKKRPASFFPAGGPSQRTGSRMEGTALHDHEKRKGFQKRGTVLFPSWTADKGICRSDPPECAGSTKRRNRCRLPVP